MKVQDVFAGFLEHCEAYLNGKPVKYRSRDGRGFQPAITGQIGRFIFFREKERTR